MLGPITLSASAALAERCDRSLSRSTAILAEGNRVRARSRALREQSRQRRMQSAASRGTMERNLEAIRRRFHQLLDVRRSLVEEVGRLRTHLSLLPARARRSKPLLVPAAPVIAGGVSGGRVLREWRGTGARAPGGYRADTRNGSPIPLWPIEPHPVSKRSPFTIGGRPLSARKVGS